MNGWTAELKLPAVILIVLMVVWHVAQWAYSQPRVDIPDNSSNSTAARVDPKGTGPIAGIDLER